MMARKWALFFWGGLGLISFGISTGIIYKFLYLIFKTNQ
jgi:hypothetical protein